MVCFFLMAEGRPEQTGIAAAAPWQSPERCPAVAPRPKAGSRERGGRLRDRAWLLSGGSGHPWGHSLQQLWGGGSTDAKRDIWAVHLPGSHPASHSPSLSSLLSPRHPVFLAFSVCHRTLLILHASLNVISSEKAPVIPKPSFPKPQE